LYLRLAHVNAPSYTWQSQLAATIGGFEIRFGRGPEFEPGASRSRTVNSGLRLGPGGSGYHSAEYESGPEGTARDG